MLVVIVFLAALVACLVGTPLGMRAGRGLGLLDRVGRVRTIHAEAVPRSGGLAVAGAVLGVLSAVLLLHGAPGGAQRSLGTFLAGGALFFAIGLLDDLRPLRPRAKLACQLVGALGAYAAGFEIEHLAAFDSEIILPPAAACALTVAWLVGIVNAVNLIDGSDGLAGGYTACCAGAIALIGDQRGDAATALAAAAVAGASLGFLRFNFAPARVFLGDAGSLFLGAALAMLALRASARPSGAITLGVPVVLLGLPILDTALAIARRLALGRPIASSDADHIHHRLLLRGLSPRQVALLVYLLGAVSALLAVVYARIRGVDRWLLLGAIAALVLGGLVALDYVPLRRGAWRRLRARRERNLAVRRALSQLAREPACDEPFSRAAARLGPIVGAPVITLEQGGAVQAWHDPSSSAMDVQHHRFAAVAPGGRHLGTLSILLPSEDAADLGLLVEGLCRLLAPPPARRPADPPRPTPRRDGGVAAGRAGGAARRSRGAGASRRRARR